VDGLIQALESGPLQLGDYSLGSAVLSLLLAFVLGQLIAWTYVWTHSGLSYSRSYTQSLVMMTLVVALVMFVIGNSIVTAFGLLGALALIRFRNVLKDTRDTSFILWAILEGLGVGTLRFSTALIGALGVGLVLLYLRVTSFGARHRYDAVLDLRMQSPDTRDLLKPVLLRHCLRTLLADFRSFGPDGVQLSYRLVLRDPERSDELRDELARSAGVADVSLLLHEDEAEL
jgi:hypothetical protein